MVKKNGNNALMALTTAALGLPAIAPQQSAAQAPPENYITSYRYSEYSEGDQGAAVVDGTVIGSKKPRYDITVHQLHFSGPAGNDLGLTVDFNTESMSGASPWYVLADSQNRPVQVMSGASITEKRDELAVNLAKYNDATKRAFGVSYSTENDYNSLGFNFGSTNWFDNNNTTVDFGFSYSNDSIRPTQQTGILRINKEDKKSFSVSGGVTRVINRNLVVGSSASIAHYSGFLSDPYKQAWVERGQVPDSRPDNKDQMALNLQARQFVERFNSALHADYRFFANSWGTTSHTFRLVWYYNLNEKIQIAPSVRYYNQTAANFFRNFYIQPRGDEYYSSDYRLSAFESMSFKLRTSYIQDWGKIHLSFESYSSESTVTGNQFSSPGLVDFNTITLGFDLIR